MAHFVSYSSQDLYTLRLSGKSVYIHRAQCTAQCPHLSLRTTVCGPLSDGQWGCHQQENPHSSLLICTVLLFPKRFFFVFSLCGSVKSTFILCIVSACLPIPSMLLLRLWHCLIKRLSQHFVRCLWPEAGIWSIKTISGNVLLKHVHLLHHIIDLVTIEEP